MKTFVTLHYGIEQFFFVFLPAKFNNEQQQQKVHILCLSLTSTKKEMPLVNMYVTIFLKIDFNWLPLKES